MSDRKRRDQARDERRAARRSNSPGISTRLARLVLFLGLVQASMPLLVEIWEPQGSGGFGLHLVCLWSAIILGGLLAISLLGQLTGILNRAYRNLKWNTLLHLVAIAAITGGTLRLLEH